MKVLITGANGMLAKDIILKFQENFEIIVTNKKTLDITNEKEVISKIEKENPDYIINCAAYTDVNQAENDCKLANEVNCLGVSYLAKAAKNNNAILVHISTDYVFDGTLDLSKDYVENNVTNPISVYGKTKADGEKEIIKNLDKYYIFRTSWLFGIGGNNFVKTIIGLSNSNSINVVSDQYGSPTYTKDLADIIYTALNNKIPYGIYNATNLGYTSWFEFAKNILKMKSITNCNINSVTTEEYVKSINVRQANRPKNSKLSKNKILTYIQNIPEWEDALKRYLAEEKENVGGAIDE